MRLSTRVYDIIGRGVIYKGFEERKGQLPRVELGPEAPQAPMLNRYTTAAI